MLLDLLRDEQYIPQINKMYSNESSYRLILVWLRGMTIILFESGVKRMRALRIKRQKQQHTDKKKTAKKLVDIHLK